MLSVAVQQGLWVPHSLTARHCSLEPPVGITHGVPVTSSHAGLWPVLFLPSPQHELSCSLTCFLPQASRTPHLPGPASSPFRLLCWLLSPYPGLRESPELSSLYFFSICTHSLVLWSHLLAFSTLHVHSRVCHSLPDLLPPTSVGVLPMSTAVTHRHLRADASKPRWFSPCIPHGPNTRGPSSLWKESTCLSRAQAQSHRAALNPSALLPPRVPSIKDLF